MAIDDKSIRTEFTAQAENYRRGQTLFLIDGSGSMPMAYGAGGNPVVTAVSYAAEVKKQLNPAALAFFFSDSDPERSMVHIDLVSGENPMQRFPGGGSFFIPAFDHLADTYMRGQLDKNLHLVIVSDGGIAEMNKDTQTKLRNFIKDNPGVLLDVIVPGNMTSDFGNMVSGLLPDGDRQKPLVMTAASPEELPIVMAKVMNTRCGAQGFYELAAYEAQHGLTEPVKVRSPLKLRKNGID